MDKVFTVITAVVIYVLISWIPFYFLWNWVAPVIGINELNFMQSLGVLIAARLMFSYK